MNDNYTAPSGGAIYAGMVAPVAKPAWLTAQSGTWGVIPTTNTLNDINPRYDPLLNPVYPSKPEWEGGNYGDRIGSWNGAAYDSATKRLFIGPAGGHGNYGGNDVSRLDISEATPTWRRICNPTGSLPDAIICDDGQEATGLYADGRIRPPHTYNGCLYIPNVGPALGVLGSSVFKTNGGPSKPAIFDKDSGELLHFGEVPSFSLGSSVVVAAAYDQSRHAIYVRRAGTGAVGKYSLNPDSMGGTWSSIGGVSQGLSGGYLSLTYLQNHDCLLIITNAASANITVIDCATGATFKPSWSGTLSGDWSRTAPKYLPECDKVLMWNNPADKRASLYALNVPENPRTGLWEVLELTPSASNTVLPTAQQTNGTYGRFFHDPALKIFGVLNGIGEQPYYFNYDGWL